MMTKPNEVNVADAMFRKWWPIVVVFAVAAGLIALLFLIPSNAQAAGGNGRAPMPVRKVATAVNYGSGIWTGPLPTVTRTGNPATASVTLVGDSIGVRCSPDIAAALAVEGKTLAVIAQSSQNTQGLVDLVTAEPSIGGKLYMEAGTNDVFSPAAMAAQITRLQDWAAANSVEVFWGDTYVGRPTALASDIRNSGWVNSFIYSAVPYDHIVKWQPALAAAVGRANGSLAMIDNYLQDGVHPWLNAGSGHGDGCAFFAAVVAAAL